MCASCETVEHAARQRDVAVAASAEYLGAVDPDTVHAARIADLAALTAGQIVHAPQRAARDRRRVEQQEVRAAHKAAKPRPLACFRRPASVTLSPLPAQAREAAMPGTYRATIPYESLDPLTIGAADDPAMVYRETLTLDIPEENLLAAIHPDEPAPIARPTEAAAAALETPHSGPPFSALIGPDKSVAIIIDNQFRPTPTSKLLPAVLDAVEAAGVRDARVVCANGKVFPMSERDIALKLGRENLARMERRGIPFFQNEPREPDRYVFVGMTSGGTPVWLHKEVATADVTLAMGQAQSNHWGAGGGGKLILPGVVSDETIESNHCAFVMSPKTHYGAMAGPMRTDIDEAASMCGLSATLNSVLDTRGRLCFVNFGAHPDAHREAIRHFKRNLRL